MSKKNHSPGSVPPGNRPHSGPAFKPNEEEEPVGDTSASTDQEQDPQRRLGGFEGKGEHALQQPGRLNDGDTHSQ